mgnify:CR=1 FL=1
MKNYKLNESSITLIFGMVSYLYLFNSFLHKDYYLIFLYFSTLIVGYLIINKKIFIFNSGIILYDLVKKNILKEGAKNFEESWGDGQKSAKDNPNYDSSSESDSDFDLSEDEVDELDEDLNNDIENDKAKNKKKNKKHLTKQDTGLTNVPDLPR